MFYACYLADATRGQISILWNRVPVDRVIEDPASPEVVKQKLQHIKTVREWASKNIGLKTDSSFLKYSKLDRKAVAWNVTASRELRFEPKTWWFPIVGTVPYLGFFSEEKAKQEAESLKKDGWETLVSEVAGYSTLGWFEDPIVSPQLEYSNWHLTRLVIHECTHATLWFPGHVDFNESFASFVELEGALQYYRQTEGESSEAYQRKLKALAESAKLKQLFHSYASRLNTMYQESKPDDVKRSSKTAIINDLRNELRTRKSEFAVMNLDGYKDTEFSNPYFLSFLRYESGDTFFKQIFDDCNKDWKCFFDKMRSYDGKLPENWKTGEKTAAK